MDISVAKYNKQVVYECMKDENAMLDLKDKAMSALAAPLLGKYIQPYGKLEALDINSVEKRIVIRVLPKGEDRSVTVTVHGGAIVLAEGRQFFTWESAVVSRTWLQQLAEVFLPEKRIAVPASVAAILSKAL